MKRGTIGAIAAALLVNLTLPLGDARAASRSDPVDPKLKAAYLRLHFDQLYPPDVIQFIEDKLQTATQPLDVLADLAHDNRPDVRVFVAMLLAELGDGEAAKTLWTLLRDDSELVRVTAGGALVRLAQQAPIAVSAGGLKDDRPEVRRLTAGTLRKLGEKGAETALIDALQDENEMVRMEVATALSECGSNNCVPSLIDRLQDRSVLVRAAAASALGHFDDTASISALVKVLKDRDWHVRAAAVQSLAMVTSRASDRAAVTEPLINTLRSDDYALVRDRAADALGYADDEKAMQALVQALVSDNRDVRFHAAQAIANAKAQSALPLLMEHRHDSNPEVREKIIDVFGKIGGNNQLPAIIEGTNDPDPTVQLVALTALRRLHERGGGDVLLQKIADVNPHVRAAAARGLGDMGDKSVTPKLVPLLRDESSYVRSAAAEALGKLGDRTAIKPLMQLLAGERPVEENRTEGGLVIGTGSATDFLTQMSQLTEVQQKTRAVEALGVLRAPEAVDSIVKFGLKAEDPVLRAVSAYSLGQIRDVRAVEPLQDAVRPYYAAAPVNLDYVIDPGGAKVSDTLRRQKEKEARVRASVVWALGQIGDSTARETLVHAVNDENSLVRDAATEALAKIAEHEERVVAGGPGGRTR